MTNLNIFDCLIILFGLYMVYNGIIMKNQREIKSGVVLSKSVNPDDIKDKDGFIGYMWWKLVVMGVLCSISGVLNVLLSLWGSDSRIAFYIQVTMNMLFLVLLIIYAVITMKAQKKYLNQ